MSDEDGELRAWVERLEHDLAELRETVTDRNADGVADTTGTGAEAKFEPVFANVEEFVRGIFAPLFARHEGAGARWCAQWWDHGEAVLRLEALWRSWEALRLDPVLGMSRWLRDHLDPQLAVLTSAAEPFQSCNSHRPRTSTTRPRRCASRTPRTATGRAGSCSTRASVLAAGGICQFRRPRSGVAVSRRTCR